jgi:hypothetical protein
MTQPLGFSDKQIQMLVEAARPLAPDDRSEFLAELVDYLPLGRAVSNADLRQAIARAQRAVRDGELWGA